MPTPEGKVDGAQEGAIGWIIFDNPARLNAISSEMAAQALSLVNEYSDDPAIRVLVLRGAGTKAFMSGGDISKYSERRRDAKSTEADRQNFNDLKAALRTSGKPVIAMLYGYCLGAGMSLALSADVRLAAGTARFGIPAAKRALSLPLDNLKEILAIVGPAVAKDIIFSGRHIEAGEAAQLGLVSRVVPTDALERETRAYATTLAENAPLTIQSAKFCLDELLKPEAGQDHGRMTALINATLNSDDFQEATRAFMEKRSPVFRGT